MQVYILHHTHLLNEDYEDVKLIGIFSSKEKANKAQKQLETVDGFKDNLYGFSIEMYELDVSHWQEGYVTV